jgi:hypothetical protein
MTLRASPLACGSLWLQLLAIETDTQTYLLHLRAFPYTKSQKKYPLSVLYPCWYCNQYNGLVLTRKTALVP